MIKKACMLLIFICLCGIFMHMIKDNTFIFTSDPEEGSSVKIEEDREETIYYDNGNLSINNPIIDTQSKNASYKRIKSTYGYKNLTSDAELELYELMTKKICTISTKTEQSGEYAISPIELNGATLDAHTIKKVLKAFQYDHPEVFWISNTINFIKRRNSTIIKFRSVISPTECNEIIRNLNSEISDIVRNVPNGLSEYQRELYMHDLLIKRCKYSRNARLKKSGWRKFTIVGAFLDGEAVCEGFSKGMQILLSSVGIESMLITGHKKEEPHMWNLVKIDGKWYHVDVTWDSSKEISRYNYFNLDDSSIKFDHLIEKELSAISPSKLKDDRYNFNLPKCTSMEENYIYKNGLRFDSMDRATDNHMVAGIKKIISERGRYLYIIIGSKLDYSSTIKKLFTQNPYKFFRYLNDLTRSRGIKNNIDRQKIYFTENRGINAVTVELNYV